jgi:hypothetical protein
MFLITKHAMLDTGFWLPAIALAQARQAGIPDEKMNKDSIYKLSSIQHPGSSIGWR